ncbi:MAG: HEPN domain-containing protein [Planctomycetaceae bacterium]
MPPTTLFNELKQRVDELGSHLLPAIKSNLTYTGAEYDCVRAYILLVHAEIEAYLEQRVQDEIDHRIDKWETSRAASVVLMGLLAFHKGEWVGPIDSLTSPNGGDKNPTWFNRDVDRRLKQCRTQTVASLKKNNGVKAVDILQMLLRLGFRVDDIDPDLISKLDVLGTDRGKIAHNAVRAVTALPDPSLAKSKVTEILAKLKDLDGAISKLP